MIFRFDDVCINSDIGMHKQIADYIIKKYNNVASVIWAISPLVCKSEKALQRVFPKRWNALSDYKEFYKMDNLGIPHIPEYIVRASHGLVHIDHRLLSFGAQEMSILLSCSFINAKIFVPPFNKWNGDTEKICIENGIKLVKFESDWLGMEHNKFNIDQTKWYLHAREWTLESLKEWFCE